MLKPLLGDEVGLDLAYKIHKLKILEKNYVQRKISRNTLFTRNDKCYPPIIFSPLPHLLLQDP